MLKALLDERVAWVRSRPAGAPDSVVLVVLRAFDPADLVRGARDFAAALEPAESDGWVRSWTRARFLFGNPANLPGARVVAPAGTAAWLGPFPVAHLPGRSRLLKPVTGELPRLPAEVDVDPGAGRTLRVAVEGLTLVDYLVHLHHTVAEAVLRQRLRPDEPVRLCHGPLSGSESAAYARVLPEPGGLRAYAALC